MAVTFALCLPVCAMAYIGPGAGIAVLGSLVAVFTATLSALLALSTWPIRHLVRAIKRGRIFSRSRIKKCVVLGLDGMDYALTDKLLSEGKLPNFARLRDQGHFGPLSSTTPPISPVAWSSFQTGSNPGKHNIFDFLAYDRRNYRPQLSSVDIRETGRKIRLGKFQLPLGGGSVRLMRKGKPFWVTLGEYGIFSSVLRVPITFPAEKFYGVQLSAMCVPDLNGTQGTFSFYTTQTIEQDTHMVGNSIHVTPQGNTVEAELSGPQDPHCRAEHTMKCPFKIIMEDEQTGWLEVSGTRYALSTGEYTEWVKFQFKTALGLRLNGICRFLPISFSPEFKLYVTPLNIDPEKPAMPISHPTVFSSYLAKQQASYATLGLAEDTWALNENILTDETFIKQVTDIDTERQTMFFDSLDKTSNGLCVCVFDALDRIQHTFWREIDDDTPVNHEEGGVDPGPTIEAFYQRMDDLLGRVLDQCRSEDSLLMVISDHGFNAFRFGVDLNRWLEEKGYLVLKPEGRHKRNLEGVDWARTRAFALGLSGLYLNIKGREAHGTVAPAGAAALRQEIASQLRGLTHGDQADAPAVKQVYESDVVYRGPYKDHAPDLIVGYSRGYRVCWEAAIGQVTDGVFHKNDKPWSGDHCVDQSLVPGVLFCNRRIKGQSPHLMDMGPTILDMFGVKVPAYMDGKTLTVSEAAENTASGGREDVS